MRRREMLLMLGCGVCIRAQDATFSTGIKLVNVLVTVRDRQGRLVQDLTQADFELREDGRIQQVRYFSRQTDVPLTLGMLVDTSASQRLVLETEQNAGREFFWQVLRPDKDSAFVIRFDVEVELTQDSTSSLTTLDKALNSLDVPSRAGRGRFGGIGTLLYDSIFLAADEVLKGLDGRKAVILLSDGVDYGSKVTLERAVETTQKADTSVYSIHIFDASNNGAFGRLRLGRLAGRRQRNNGENALRRISEETGGKYFEVTDAKPLEDVFREVEADLRNQYSLGYVSGRPAAATEFRRIQVTAKRRGVATQARSGYYAQP